MMLSLLREVLSTRLQDITISGVLHRLPEIDGRIQNVPAGSDANFFGLYELDDYRQRFLLLSFAYT